MLGIVEVVEIVRVISDGLEFVFDVGIGCLCGCFKV